MNVYENKINCSFSFFFNSNGSDNINETKSEKPVNLRHQLNNDDLHEQQEELNEQKIRTETMGKEFKRLHEAPSSFGKTLDRVFNETDTETPETRMVRIKILLIV